VHARLVDPLHHGTAALTTALPGRSSSPPSYQLGWQRTGGGSKLYAKARHPASLTLLILIAARYTGAIEVLVLVAGTGAL